MLHHPTRSDPAADHLINRLRMSGAMGIPARSLSSRIPPDALTGNNPNGRRLLAEMWRPTPRSLLRKAGANIAELRRILLFRTSAAGDSFCASDCPVRKQSSANHFESRTGSATAPYRPMIANPSPLNRHRKRTARIAFMPLLTDTDGGATATKLSSAWCACCDQRRTYSC